MQNFNSDMINTQVIFGGKTHTDILSLSHLLIPVALVDSNGTGHHQYQRYCKHQAPTYKIHESQSSRGAWRFGFGQDGYVLSDQFNVWRRQQMSLVTGQWGSFRRNPGILILWVRFVHIPIGGYSTLTAVHLRSTYVYICRKIACKRKWAHINR